MFRLTVERPGQHFNLSGLRDVVVLQPAWLLNHMRNMLCLAHLPAMIEDSEDIDEKRELLELRAMMDQRIGPLRSALLELRERGMLDADMVLPVIWAELSETDRATMLQYMVHFALCCPLPTDETQKVCYAVPSLFADIAVDSSWPPATSDLQASLAFIHGDGFFNDQRSGYLPAALFHSLIVRLLAHAVDTREALRQFYHDHVIVESEDVVYSLRMQRAECRIYLTVRGSSAQPVGFIALEQVRQHLVEMESKYGVRWRVEVRRCSGSEWINLSTQRGCETRQRDDEACRPWIQPQPEELPQPEPAPQHEMLTLDADEPEFNADDSPEDDLHALLVRAKVVKHERALVDEGYVEIEDLQCADEADLLAVGFKKAEIKRLGRHLKDSSMAKAVGVPPTSMSAPGPAGLQEGLPVVSTPAATGSSNAVAFPLPEGKQYHFFLCHHQVRRVH